MNNMHRTHSAVKAGRPIIVAGLAALLLSSAVAQNTSYGATLSLFNAEGTMITEDWRVVNDDVMGGISKSAIKSTSDGSLIFKGNVSLENNGGFASARSPSIDEDMGSYDGIELLLTGDGKSYKCTLRTDKKFDGVSHQSSFNTVAGKEQRIRIPFKDFDPTWRGRRLSESKRMNPGEISSIGFMISDKQEGPFQLEVKSISAYREDGQETPESGSDIISIAQQAGTFKTLLAAVEAAGLTDTVRSFEGVTLFAPTDEAFGKLPDGTIASLLEPQNKDALVNILSYHVIGAEVPFSTATTLTRATALNGEQISISVKKGGLLLNDTRVIENDIKTSNGIIHVIDSVLLPPEKEPLELPPVEKLISSAISRGVPLFNNENPQACADIYELAAEALLTLPEDQLSKKQREILTDALGRSQQQHSATDRAWTMRIALDKTLAHSVE